MAREHSTGADMVEMTVLDPNYPPELLQRQIEAFTENLRGGLRGLELFRLTRTEGGEGFLKASFSTDHFIDRPEQAYDLQALARAFADSPEPFGVEGLLVIFESEMPTGRTLQTYAAPDDSVWVEGTVLPMGLEYRIVLNTDDPEQIVIPNSFEPGPEEPMESEEPTPTEADEVVPLWLVASGILLAGLAVGGLVYFAVIKRSYRSGR